MEVNDSEIQKTIGTIIVGAFAYIWSRINGDIKANREAIKLLAANSVTKKDFDATLERLEDIQKQNRETYIKLFDKIGEHEEKDTERMTLITTTLARLEERSKQRRQNERA